MPTLAELRSRFSSATRPAKDSTAECDEALVVDSRGALSPAQMVELKLRSALHSRTPVRAGLATNNGNRRLSK